MTISSRLPNKACLSTMELLIPLVYFSGSRPIILWRTNLRVLFLLDQRVTCSELVLCSRACERRDTPSMLG